MTDPITKVSLGSVSIILPSTGKIIILSVYPPYGSNGWYTLKDKDVDYIVPSGKQFWICVVRSKNNNEFPVNIEYNTSSTGGSGTLINAIYTYTNDTFVDIPLFTSVPAGNYINVENSGQYGLGNLLIYGIELNA